MRRSSHPLPRAGILASSILILVLLAGCGSAAAPAPATATSPAPAEPTSVSTNTLAPTPTSPPTATAVPPTATPVPPTDTPLPTATPALAVVPDQLSAYCLPEDMLPPTDPANPPANARQGQFSESGLEINNLPASTCTLLFTFNQRMPQGVTFQLYELNNATPWLKAELTPLPDQPNSAYVTLKHSYVVAPPYYDISYNFSLNGPDGSPLMQAQANLHRWKPKLCWNGRYPSLKTGRCPLPQDLHPWDPSYGTPIPTFPPEGN